MVLHACTYCCGYFRWMPCILRHCLHMLFMIWFSNYFLLHHTQVELLYEMSGWMWNWSLGSNSMWYAGSSFADTKEGRYNPKMHPIIPVHNWRKGSQVTISFKFQLSYGVEKSLIFLNPTYSIVYLTILLVGCFSQKAC